MTIATLIAYLIAVAIPAFAVYLMFTQDLFGTGKRSTVLVALGWGATGAFGLAYILNTALTRLPGVGFEKVATLFAPILEETLKALVLIFLFLQPRFRYAVDGAVYGFAVGIGFSMTENLFYLSVNPGATLMLAISRVLSSSLMHATASASVGISLGLLRRSRSRAVFGWSFLGVVLTYGLHIAFNNMVSNLEGLPRLLIAVGIGIGGSILIAFLINKGLSEEKKHFAETLGLKVGVTTAERKAVQQLGGNAIEQILQELGGYFGGERAESIRRLLVIQANIGILQNNLNNPASPRLRQAWTDEIAGLHKEIDQIRNELGIYVMSFLRNVFPEDDATLANSVQQELTKSDPTLIHTFDIFMTASKMAGTLRPEQLERIGETLHKVEIFKDVSLADLENMSRAAVVRSFSDGQLLFDEGDQGDTLYLIEQGGISLYTRGRNNQEKLLRTCEAGDVVGELALLDGYPRSARAVASGALTVLMLRREHFMMFIQSRPQVIYALLQFLAKRMRRLSEVVETSIAWASSIAQGNYAEALALGMPSPAPAGASAQAAAAPVPEAPQKTSESLSASLELSGVSEETPALMRGIFAKVTGVLEERERIIQQKAEESGVFLPDIGALPDPQNRIMSVVLRDRATYPNGLSLAVLRDRFDDVPNLPDILAELAQAGLLDVLGEPPDLHYKVNLRPRPGRTLESLRTWTKIDKKI